MSTLAMNKHNSVLGFSTDAALRNAVAQKMNGDSAKPTVDDEVSRLRTLKDTGVLETETNKSLDDLTESLRRKLNVTWVAACLVDLDRVHVKSAAEKEGFPFNVHSGDDTPRVGSFADASVCSGRAVDVVRDTLQDDRVNSGPWVEGSPHVRFFAGVPLHSPTRQRLGCLCVLDHKPHPEGLSAKDQVEIQSVATLISNNYLHKNQSNSGLRKRRQETKTSSEDPSNDLRSGSPPHFPSPKRRDRSRSSSPVPGAFNTPIRIPDTNLPQPSQTEADPDDYLVQLVSAMTGGVQLKIKPSTEIKDFFLTVNEEQTSRYCTKVVSMARANDVSGLEELYKDQGRDALDCYNRFGEGLLTLACRRGFKEMVSFLLSSKVDLSLRVRDDYGRTVVHDACWNPEPQLEICSWLLKREPSLFLLSDKRGFSPFQYARKSDWGVWRQFLFDHKEQLLGLANSENSSLFVVG